jgi:hypothetical protein
MRFVVNKVTLGQVFLSQYYSFRLLVSFHESSVPVHKRTKPRGSADIAELAELSESV